MKTKVQAKDKCKNHNDCDDNCYYQPEGTSSEPLAGSSGLLIVRQHA